MKSVEQTRSGAQVQGASQPSAPSHICPAAQSALLWQVAAACPEPSAAPQAKSVRAMPKMKTLMLVMETRLARKGGTLGSRLIRGS